MADADAQQATRILLRPIASPFGLGFIGLAAASLVVSGLELGWFSGPERDQAAIVLIAFTPVVQLVASIFGFLGRDPVVATGMGILGATWLVFGLIVLSTPGGSTSDVLGAFLLVSATGLLLLAACAAEFKLVPAAVIALAAIRFGAGAIHELTAEPFWQELAGILGLLVCAAAVYALASLELEDARRSTVLPTLRRGEGRVALDAGLHGQTDEVASEAGVRKQL